uniref:Plastid lipid-associated protein/fibrillin conserved domain-containing protein n=1 Tax=Phaeomonas parva TaxID=124430 RepID=A0A7S1TTL6_9STRA|mmetsp:Transcript_1525/g.4152  ORF Transcript_1525/g.4152 Transcript_1525/m.4152 type:complete len:227 (+) Transcript_1525:153-833(+)
MLPRLGLAALAAAALLVGEVDGFTQPKWLKVNPQKSLSSAAAAAALAAGVMQAPAPASAIGPQVIELSGITYTDTGKTKGDLCADRPLVPPGEKVAKGLTPKCVLVEANSESPGKKEINNAAVFGYVKTPTGDSAIANNPDFNSDAGQFASIKTVPPGVGKVSFEFVAVIPDVVNNQLGKLEFDSLKAISYPGGARYAPLTDCELDSLSDACDGALTLTLTLSLTP